MIRRIILTCAALLASAALFAQDPPTGGVKGTVIDRNGRQPVENARLKLMQGALEISSTLSAQDGTFLIPSLPDGQYILIVEAPEFLTNQVQVTVNDGYVKNMFNISMSSTNRQLPLDEDNFAAFDMDDTGFTDNPSVLFGSNDVFDNIAGYNFSAVRFRVRGYASETQDVYLAGVRLNDAITGYTPFSLWSGLNEAMRDKESFTGADISNYGLGGFNGITNIYGTASHVRKGLRGSVLTNNTLYRLRVMGSYATGMQDNGWAFATNISTRLGGNDWIKGVYYRSFSYYFAADKRFNDRHMVSLVAFGSAGERGTQTASTQEVYDLMGDNLYNANWGYQNGRVRNSRVRKTHEPVVFAQYDYTYSDRFSSELTIMARFGRNGYTALDWYDAQDPRPNYYRNLPSYFLSATNEDLNRDDDYKWGWAREVWTHASEYPQYTHVDWDKLYHINAMQENGRSKYIQEERRSNQRDLNIAWNVHTRPGKYLALNLGVFARLNYTHYYKVVGDLLGGQYYMDMDNFAERDFSTEYMLQNDLDYYLAHGTAPTLAQGDIYGYNYASQVRNVGHWWDLNFTRGNLSITAGARFSYDAYWRIGYARKGLFPGLGDDGNPLVDPKTGAEIAPTYDPDGSVTTSKGKSKILNFVTGAAKLGASYVIGGNMRVYGHVGIYTDAPKFANMFISPRTRNTLVPDAKTSHTFSSDLNWQYSGHGINLRATVFYSYMGGQSKVMTAYDDVYHSYSSFAITGIDERHTGLELGFKVPTYIVPNLTVQGALSLGEYVYTSTPKMTQTIDNSAEIVMENVPLSYWKSTVLLDGTQIKHYVPSTPQTAASLGLSYNYNYWFIEGDVQYFDRAYLDMSPLYRTTAAVCGPAEHDVTDEEILYMTSQEKFKPAFLVNLSVGKSWYIQRKYQLGFSCNVKNLLNNTNVKTGGFEQTRLVSKTDQGTRYYRFDPKYFYMSGINYMLNIYFRF